MQRTVTPWPALQRGGAAYTSRFLMLHLVLPVAAVTLVVGWLMGSGGDLWLADHLFHLQGNQWLLRDAWSTSVVMHKGGKWLSTAAALVVMLLCFHQWRHGRDRALRWALLYLVLAIALGIGAVSLLKSLTHMDCPWDLARYGGERSFIALLQSRPASMPAAACFPAGQASAGYAWVSLYFFALLWRPAWRWAGLLTGLVAGAALGIAQQLRGAHFLSHDLSTLLVCWLVALGLFVALRAGLARPEARQQETRA